MAKKPPPARKSRLVRSSAVQSDFTGTPIESLRMAHKSLGRKVPRKATGRRLAEKPVR